MSVPSLDTAAIGWPITRLGVSFFPVYLATNGLPAIETGEASRLTVDELDEPSVQGCGCAIRATSRCWSSRASTSSAASRTAPST